ncbi:TPA: hypothetical protein ACXDAZ_002222 [Clostridium botulinum]|uniref:hypothetical protein n=1 Tax=Clostridium botulinum TaxID=1491 RepID=UPI0012BB158B|nr:hypothetical protein [Clostridium botulinum]MCS4446751.1 hypothetical protein [Clostridium botulinum]MCS4459048.1 hypothetical protein [Clostridium botulinum]MCS4462435.1 hypothetical protein [Clostridium botulinum]MCS4513875.1 hypothetical protein [Clostridium botulinum]MCS4518753.1 hypothetical protein [Clostridium botulinum]
MVINYLEDSFYSLDEVQKHCPKDDENYELINTAIENLIKAHDNICNKIRE